MTIGDVSNNGPWFDAYHALNPDIPIEDPFAELAANEECVKCIKGWFMAKGNLTMASMIGAIAGMMGDKQITMLSSMMKDVTQKDFAKLNRMLNKIQKQ